MMTMVLTICKLVGTALAMVMGVLGILFETHTEVDGGDTNGRRRLNSIGRIFMVLVVLSGATSLVAEVIESTSRRMEELEGQKRDEMVLNNLLEQSKKTSLLVEGTRQLAAEGSVVMSKMNSQVLAVGEVSRQTQSLLTRFDSTRITMWAALPNSVGELEGLYSACETYSRTRATFVDVEVNGELTPWEAGRFGEKYLHCHNFHIELHGSNYSEAQSLIPALSEYKELCAALRSANWIVAMVKDLSKKRNYVYTPMIGDRRAGERQYWVSGDDVKTRLVYCASKKQLYVEWDLGECSDHERFNDGSLSGISDLIDVGVIVVGMFSSNGRSGTYDKVISSLSPFAMNVGLEKHHVTVRSLQSLESSGSMYSFILQLPPYKAIMAGAGYVYPIDAGDGEICNRVQSTERSRIGFLE